jgi:hypothetical protein
VVGGRQLSPRVRRIDRYRLGDAERLRQRPFASSPPIVPADRPPSPNDGVHLVGHAHPDRFRRADLHRSPDPHGAPLRAVRPRARSTGRPPYVEDRAHTEEAGKLARRRPTRCRSGRCLAPPQPQDPGRQQPGGVPGGLEVVARIRRGHANGVNATASGDHRAAAGHRCAIAGHRADGRAATLRPGLHDEVSGSCSATLSSNCAGRWV